VLPLSMAVGRQVMGVYLLASDEKKMKKVKSRKRADREATVVFLSARGCVFEYHTDFLSLPVSR